MKPSPLVWIWPALVPRVAEKLQLSQTSISDFDTNYRGMWSSAI